MPLLAGGLLARIVAGRTDPNPPFSALFTLWLSRRRLGSPASPPPPGIAHTARDALARLCHHNSSASGSRALCFLAAGPWANSAIGSQCSAHTSRRSSPPAPPPSVVARHAWPVGSAVQPVPTPRRSGQTDSAACRGCSEGGSQSSTSAPPAKRVPDTESHLIRAAQAPARNRF